MKILFVCRANIGRSQMASSLFKSLTDKHEVRSAGTKVIDSLTGESMDGQLLKNKKGAENVILVLKEIGINVEENSRTQLSPDMVEWADKIFCMAEPENIPDYLAQSPKLTRWKIVDPKGTAYEAHKEILLQIQGLVKELIENID